MKREKIIWVLVLLLWCWGILAFFGIFDLIPKAQASFMEVTKNDNNELQYFILTNFTTDGAFMSSKPIEVYIELTRVSENQPVFDNYDVYVGGSDTYLYPKEVNNGIFKNAVATLTKNGENKWTGSVTAVFDQPGNFPIYSFITNTESPIIFSSSKSIHIEPHSVSLSVLQNRMIFALTLILVGFGLIGLILRNKKS